MVHRRRLRQCVRGCETRVPWCGCAGYLNMRHGRLADCDTSFGGEQDQMSAWKVAKQVWT